LSEISRVHLTVKAAERVDFFVASGERDPSRGNGLAGGVADKPMLQCGRSCGVWVNVGYAVQRKNVLGLCDGPRFELFAVAELAWQCRIGVADRLS
jgi:hypothetical protein